jgi:transposase
MLRQKWSRGQVETRLANLPPCLIGMEACVGAHHLSRKLRTLGHDALEMSCLKDGSAMRDGSVMHSTVRLGLLVCIMAMNPTADPAQTSQARPF